GYTAMSISPDGKWGLLLGPKSEAKVKDDGREHGKDSDADDSGGSTSTNDGSDPQSAASTALPARPFSLFRAKLEGAHTQHPSVVETDDDGAGLWLPEVP